MDPQAMCHMFLKSSFDRILAEREIKKREHLQLKKACESALEELNAASNGEVHAGAAVEADRYFLPFELACNSRYPKIVIIALDSLQKLIGHGFLTGRGADISNPERRLIDRIVEAICSASPVAGTDEDVILHVIKVILTVVLSPHCDVHDASLLLAVRTCFNIHLYSRRTLNQTTSKGILTQIVTEVFLNMEKFGNMKDDSTVVKETLEMIVSTVVAMETSDAKSELGTRRNGSTMGESEAIQDDQYLHFDNIYQKDAFILFRTFCILAQKEEGDPNDQGNSHLQSKLLALEMLLSILQKSSTVFQNSQPLIIIIKKQLCVALSKNSVSSNDKVFGISLAIFVELFYKFKQHLKMQIEVFFKEIILSMMESTSCPFEKKWMVFNTIGKILGNPQSVVDMFVNYDCDMTSHNLFKSIVEIVSKTTRQAINESASLAQKKEERAMRLLGLSCLTDLLQCIVDWFQVCEIAKLSYDITDGETSERELSNDFERFENLKQKKDLMEQGIALFAEKPKKGLKFLQDKGFVGTEAVEIAEFLMREERLDKTVVGDYLGDHDEFNKQVMYAYVDDLDFSSLDIVTALRIFLEKFRLPGEAQKIDRLMEKFASRYCYCNPGLTMFASADTAYVLAYSIILLTTDLHNAQVKSKMTQEQYIKMNRGINNEGDLPSDLLIAIYEDISRNEIKMKAGASKLLKSATGANSSTDKERRAMATLEMKAMSETARTLMESASDADANYIPAQHQHHVKPMFNICWTPALAAFSVGLQMSDDEEEWSLCLRGFRLGVRAACVLNATLERNAFIQALARFTLLTAKNSLADMKVKNIEAIKLLLLIGAEDGDFLEENWVDVMKCISSLELVQLIGTGLKSGSTGGDSSRQYVLRSTGGIDERTLATLQDALGEAASQVVVVGIDRIFNGSSKLSSEAIVHFVKAVCAVSKEELSQPSAPRMFMLQKMVEVAFYNMNRIRLDWLRIWSVIGDHFNFAGTNTNDSVAYFSVDALRQLSIKFLEKGELPNFSFQKEFLKPFESIMQNNKSDATRDLVICCCSQLVEAHSHSLKSGWKNLFAVWMTAASDSNADIVEASFLAATNVISKQFKADFPFFLDSFQEALKCLQEFACNSNMPDMNMEAIQMIRECAKYVSKNRDKIVAESVGEDNKFITADQLFWLRGWLPIFFDLSCIINRCKLDVRTRALTVMFDIMKTYGDGFPPELWKDLLNVVFRIFDKARIGERGNDKREWLSTTCNHAMLSVVDVFTQFYDKLSLYALPMLYKQFSVFMLQENEQLARCTISCIESLVLQNGSKFSEDMWEQTITLIQSLFKTTLPNGLKEYVPDINDAIVQKRDVEMEKSSLQKEELFTQQIVFCVIQNELVEALNRIILGSKNHPEEALFNIISPQALMRICDSLVESHIFARKFNDDNSQRTLLWKAGLRGSSKPNLINQETRSLSLILAIVIRLLYDERAKSLNKEVSAKVLEVVTLSFEGYAPSSQQSAETRRTAFGPVICDLLKECVILPLELLPALGDEFPTKLCDLVETAEGSAMKKLCADVLRRLMGSLIDKSNKKPIVNGVVHNSNGIEEES